MQTRQILAVGQEAQEPKGAEETQETQVAESVHLYSSESLVFPVDHVTPKLVGYIRQLARAAKALHQIICLTRSAKFRQTNPCSCTNGE